MVMHYKASEILSVYRMGTSYVEMFYILLNVTTTTILTVIW